MKVTREDLNVGKLWRNIHCNDASGPEYIYLSEMRDNSLYIGSKESTENNPNYTWFDYLIADFNITFREYKTEEQVAELKLLCLLIGIHRLEGTFDIKNLLVEMDI